MKAARPGAGVLASIGWLWLGVWLAYLVTAGGTLATSDATSTIALAESMVDRGRVNVPAELSQWQGPDGDYYLPFGIGQALYDVPFLVGGRIVLRAAGVPAARQEPFLKSGIALASTLSASLCAAAIAGLGWRFSRDRRTAFLVGLAAAFATPLWPYSKFGFSAPLVAALLAGGVFLVAGAAEDERHSNLLWGGLLLGAAILVRYEAVLAAGVAVLWVGCLPSPAAVRVRRVALAAAGAAIAGVATIAYNVSRFGAPFSTGHTPDITWRGAWGLVASPAASVVVFAPITVVGVLALARAVRSRTPVAWLVAAVAGSLALFYASLDDFVGTRSYGPRYLVPVVALLVAPIAAWVGSGAERTWRGRVAVGLTVLSLLVQVPAVAVDFSRAGIAAGRPSRVTEWRWSPLVVAARAAARDVPENLRYVAGIDPKPAVERYAGEKSLSERLAFSLDFWWLYAWYLGLASRGTALLAAAAVAAASVGCLLMGWRATTARPIGRGLQ